MKYVPKSISKPFPGYLKAAWNDGFEAVIKLEKFRKECPCADCREKDESTPSGVKFFMPTIKPGQNDLKELTPVGNYALNAIWGDGHNSGIYTWEYFRIVFESNQISNEELIKLNLANN